MKLSEVVRVTRETVSYETLQEKLPTECFNAITEKHFRNENYNLEETLQEYFNAIPPTPLNEEEQKELFEQLGNEWVKNHYSTDQLRGLLEPKTFNKRIRS